MHDRDKYSSEIIQGNQFLDRIDGFDLLGTLMK